MIKKFQIYISELLPSGFSFIRQSTVAKNAVALYIIQFSTILLPLITIPHVVRILGPANFGIVSFCQGLVSYFSLAVDYGFNLSSTRNVAVCQEDKEEINRIFSSTIITKLILFLIGFFVLGALFLTVPLIRAKAPLMMITYIGILGNVLFPIWLFQGYEKMQFLTISSLISNLLMVASVFLLINCHNGIYVYLLILTCTQIINGLLCFIKSFYQFKVRLIRINWAGIAKSLNDGWALFLSNASGSLYLVGNSFILGLFVSPVIVGYYSGAEKIIKGVLSFLSPICQAIYPKFAKLVVISREKFFYWSGKLLFIMGSIGILMAIASYILAPILVRVILGAGFLSAIPLVRLMAPIPIFVSLSFVLGGQILIPLKQDKQYAFSLFFGGIINLLIVLIFAKKVGQYASGIGLLTAEFSVVSVMLYYYNKAKKSLI